MLWKLNYEASERKLTFFFSWSYMSRKIKITCFLLIKTDLIVKHEIKKKNSENIKLMLSKRQKQQC